MEEELPRPNPRKLVRRLPTSPIKEKDVDVGFDSDDVIEQVDTKTSELPPSILQRKSTQVWMERMGEKKAPMNVSITEENVELQSTTSTSDNSSSANNLVWIRCTDTLNFIILNRLCEAARFDIIGRRWLDDPITLGKMRELFPDKDPKYTIDDLWQKILKRHSQPITQTFGDLLDYECRIFPETTDKQREILKELYASESIIDKKMVCSALAVGENSQLVEFLFVSGAEAIPAEIFQDIVYCLETHPRTMFFPMEFFNTMVISGRRMVSFYIYFLLVIVALVMTPYIANRRHFAAALTVEHFMEADWMSGCPKGPMSPYGCNFEQKNWNEIDYVEQDALRYIRDELIARLWQAPGKTAADGPLGYHNFAPVGSVGSTFLIGSLVLRLVPEKSTDNYDLAPIHCEQMNLSHSLYESRLAGRFDCNAMWSIIIPFNATREEAMQLASEAHAQLPIQRNSALIAQFPSFQPSSNIMVYTMLTLTLPEGGGIIKRMDVRTVDFEAYQYILPILIVCAIACLQRLLMAIYYKSQGYYFISFDLVSDFALLAALSVAYELMRNITPPGAMFQVESVAQDADRLCFQYQTGTHILAFTVMAIIIFVIRYLKDISGVQLIVGIVSHALPELISLIFIFAIWTLTFAYVADLFFGGVDPNFSSGFTSFAFLFSFFEGQGNFEHMEELHNLWGPVFWFTFKIFVFFLALNLVIAVLTAPLALMKEQADLHLQMANEVGAHLATHGTTSERFWWSCREFSFPYLNVFFDASLYPGAKLHWIHLSKSIKTLADPSHGTEASLKAALNFFHAIENDNRKTPYDSVLLRKVVQMRAMDITSLAFTVEAIASLSDKEVMRDARLVKALSEYDRFTHGISEVMKLQDKLKSRAHQLSTLPGEDENSTLFRTTSFFSRSVTAENQMFKFTLYLRGRLAAGKYSVAWMIISLGVLLAFLGLGLMKDHPAAYLTESLHLGLREKPLLQECYDENCTQAFSFNKTYMDSGDLADIYVWIDKVLLRQLWFSNDISGSEQMNGVLWDNRTSFDLPIYFRQLRAKPKSCNWDEKSATGFHGQPRFLQRLDYLRGVFQCFGDSESEFETNSIPYPSGMNLSADGFIWKDSCPERRNARYFGEMRTYPCEGYTMPIYNSSELRTLINSTWLDNATRLLAFTGTFRSGRAAVEYTMYVELGEGGGSVIPYVFAADIGEDSESYHQTFIASVIFLSLELIPFLISVLHYLKVRIRRGCSVNVGNDDSPFMQPPWPLVVYLIMVLVLPYLLFRDSSFNERIKMQLSITAFFITYVATRRTLFPIAGLLSKCGTLLFETLANSAKQCMYVVPFYVIFLVALASGGMILFAPNVDWFVQFHFALLTVSRGALGDWETTTLRMAAPEITQVYQFFFFAIVMVMLGNLVLAMVTSAEGDTLITPDFVSLSVKICARQMWRIMYGEIYEFMLAWNIWKLQKYEVKSAEAYRSLPVICIGESRLLFPTEALVTALGPHRANEIISELCLDSISESLYPSSITYVLEQYFEFAQKHPVEEVLDHERELDLLKRRKVEESERMSQRTGGTLCISVQIDDEDL